MLSRPLPEILLSVALLFGAALAQADDILLRVTGEACLLGSGKPAYREIHEIGTARHTVQYLGQGNRLIASKQLDYAQGFNTPLYRMHDLRFNRITGNEWLGDHFSIYRLESGESPKRKNVQPSADLVIDAGFDHFVREHWNRLANGESLPFSFVVADPLVTLHMRMQRVQPEQSAIPRRDPRYRYFHASSRNRLIGWAIPDIHLAYDSESRLLQAYLGPSNLTDEQDKSQQVLIEYRYDTAITLPAEGKQQP